ncbi:dehydrogenase/reductase SDR family member 7 [Pocillopora verrucosa]|uniref:dehydrogenase/reductase SDR family member 7 n=1 Tax=Pocillopora verrucosa TaxID=203993 RepID=UPI003341797E
MEVLGFFEISVVLFVVLHILRIYFADCDAILHFYERFAKPPERRLRGKVIWITGASSGIGEHLAYKLTELGCKLVLSARRKDELDRVKNQCLSLAQKLFPLTFEEDFLVLPLDITNFSTHEDSVAKALHRFGKIDFLVNNAGILQMGLSMDCDFDVVFPVLNTNVLGTISLTKAVLPHMVQNRNGQIVVISSASGKSAPVPYVAAYAASKHALQGYFNTLRMEVYDKNVGVTMICLGLTYSNLFRNAYRENLETRRDLVLPPTTMKPERCAHLIVIAMANCLDEVWIAKPSRLLELYLAQYLPLVRDWWIQRDNRNRNANLTAASRTN